MSRIVALDWGEKRIGIAVSDFSQQIAFPWITIATKKTDRETIEELLKVLKEKMPIERFVVGLPLHLDGNESPMSLRVKEFGQQLEAIARIPVIYIDERLSSKQADMRLKEHALSRKKRAEASDTMAAHILLETYLNAPKTSFLRMRTEERTP